MCCSILQNKRGFVLKLGAMWLIWSHPCLQKAHPKLHQTVPQHCAKAVFFYFGATVSLIPRMRQLPCWCWNIDVIVIRIGSQSIELFNDFFFFTLTSTCQSTLLGATSEDPDIHWDSY